MLSKYWKNTVFTGAVDFYCLACERYLKTADEVDAHLEERGHADTLAATPYYAKYEHDMIREVSSGYFCEACNFFYDIDLEVDVHVKEESHAVNLSNQLLKRSGDSVLAYNEILITDKAWSGFIGANCAICKTKVTDESAHKKDKKHILNLIQSKLEYCQGKAVYRQLNNNFQCLTCNEYVSMSAKLTHSDLTEHKNKYEECRDLNNTNNVNANQAEPKVQEQEKIKSKKSKERVVKNIPKKGKENAKKGQQKSDADDIEEYVINVLGAKNYITKKDNKKWCLLCDWSLEDFDEKQHVQSRHHLTLLKLHKDRIAKKNAGGSDVDEPVSENDEPDTDDDNNYDRILDSVADFERNGIKISFETRSASCRNCSENVDFSYDFIKNHISEHNTKNTKKDTHALKFDLNKKDDVKSKTLYTKQVTKKDKNDNTMVAQNDEIINFAKKHDLILKNNGYYCPTCNIALKVNLNALKEHIDTKGHTNRTNRKSKTPEQLTRSYAVRLPVKEFIKTTQRIDDLLFNDVVINDKYCINAMSFYLFTKNNNMCVCQVCCAAMPLHEVNSHGDIKHFEKLQDMLVITSVPDEFLRQIRIGEYHCGFCNIVVESDDLDDHLDSVSHKENRTAAQSRLVRYLPAIRAEQQQKMAELMFLQMITGMNRMVN